jgi:hypothetical protein
VTSVWIGVVTALGGLTAVFAAIPSVVRWIAAADVRHPTPRTATTATDDPYPQENEDWELILGRAASSPVVTERGHRSTA